jgi:hypothetical protein
MAGRNVSTNGAEVADVMAEGYGEKVCHKKFMPTFSPSPSLSLFCLIFCFLFFFLIILLQEQRAQCQKKKIGPKQELNPGHSGDL